MLCADNKITGGNMEKRILNWMVVGTMLGWLAIGLTMFVLAMIYGPALVREVAAIIALIVGAMLWHAKVLCGGLKPLLLLQDLQEE